VAERVEVPESTVPEPSPSELLARIRTLDEALQLRDDRLTAAAQELRDSMHTLLSEVTAALQSARCHGDLGMQRRLEHIKLLAERTVERSTVLLETNR
jgi:cysteine sulfinate desulfinase/cysteine desulfurase-like protein